MSGSTQPVGVIVARFQLPDLHAGHRHLISHVCEEHRDVLILLGTPTTPPTNRDPLPFDMRATMLRSAFAGKDIAIHRLATRRGDYRERSVQVDTLIAKHYPGRTAIIYGSRDSVVQKYSGIYPSFEVPTVFNSSATAIRNALEPVDSAHFRAGFIVGVMQRTPVAYPTVDVAVVDRPLSRVLLVGKLDEELLRFCGGFFDLELDQSLEDAAARELGEEIEGVRTTRPIIIGSARIPDWRYERTKDGIITTMTVAQYVSGVPYPSDDINRTQWCGFSDFRKQLVPEHARLGEILDEYLAQ